VSSLYNHFPGGKRELYLAVVEHAVEANRRYMEQAWNPALSALEQILAAADAYLLFHLDHPGFFQMVAIPQLSSRPDEEEADVSERIAQRVEAEVGKLRTAIAAGVECGELMSVDPTRAATFLWGAWNGVIALSTRPDRLRLGDEEIRAVLELGRRLVLEGLAPPGARVASGRLSRRVRFTTARRPGEDGPEGPLTA
jgi:TetR/AcrR family transcriptional regulator